MAGPVRLIVLPTLRPIPFEGTLYRVVTEALKDKILSTEGNRFVTGRYHLAGETGVLYTSLAEDTAMNEIKRHAGSAMVTGQFACGKIKVKLRKVLDLTHSSVLSKMGLTTEDLVADDFSLTHAIGLSARRAGFQGLMVPSATGQGENLVIFENNLGEGCRIEVESVKEIPLKIR